MLAMQFTIRHTNINVTNLEKSIAFYSEALGLQEVSRRLDPEGRFALVFMGDGVSSHRIELTWLPEHPQKYDLGENEWHIAFSVSDFKAAYEKHRQMGCICYDNTEMGLYFIEDPDGYWLEIMPE